MGPPLSFKATRFQALSGNTRTLSIGGTGRLSNLRHSSQLSAPGIVPTILETINREQLAGRWRRNRWSLSGWRRNEPLSRAIPFRNNLTGNGAGRSRCPPYSEHPVVIVQNLIYGNQAGGAGAMNLLAPERGAGTFIGHHRRKHNLSEIRVTGTATVQPELASLTDLFTDGNLAQYVLVNNIIVGNKTGTTAVNCGRRLHVASPYSARIRSQRYLRRSGRCVRRLACARPDRHLRQY